MYSRRPPFKLRCIVWYCLLTIAYFSLTTLRVHLNLGELRECSSRAFFETFQRQSRLLGLAIHCRVWYMLRQLCTSTSVNSGKYLQYSLVLFYLTSHKAIVDISHPSRSTFFGFSSPLLGAVSVTVRVIQPRYCLLDR